MSAINDGNTKDSWNALAALLIKPAVSNVWYNNKEIKLDGYKFISCRFDSCNLVITSCNFELENCFISENTNIRFGNEVAKPIRLFNVKNESAYGKIPFFAPVRNIDGTITIKA